MDDWKGLGKLCSTVLNHVLCALGIGLFIYLGKGALGRFLTGWVEKKEIINITIRNVFLWVCVLSCFEGLYIHIFLWLYELKVMDAISCSQPSSTHESWLCYLVLLPTKCSSGEHPLWQTVLKSGLLEKPTLLVVFCGIMHLHTDICIHFAPFSRWMVYGLRWCDGILLGNFSFGVPKCASPGLVPGRYAGRLC